MEWHLWQLWCKTFSDKITYQDPNIQSQSTEQDCFSCPLETMLDCSVSKALHCLYSKWTRSLTVSSRRHTHPPKLKTHFSLISWVSVHQLHVKHMCIQRLSVSAHPYCAVSSVFWTPAACGGDPHWKNIDISVRHSNDI